jgi:hypothetical protein
MPLNRLYVSIIPMIHLTDRFGLTEQVMTLFPDKNFATLFRPDEVDNYLHLLKNRAETYLRGGNVTDYEFQTEADGTGMVRVVVIQHVTL